ncbi:MAG TPA: hypothetical protein VNE17_12745 [Nitrolancea sp.]|nr:hypothetical protein [Nitrolancea sp.]
MKSGNRSGLPIGTWVVYALAAALFIFSEWIAFRRAIPSRPWNVLTYLPVVGLVLLPFSPAERRAAFVRTATGILGLIAASTYLILSMATLLVPLKLYGSGAFEFFAMFCITGGVSASLLAFGSWKHLRWEPDKGLSEVLMIVGYAGVTLWALLVFEL